MEVAMRVAGRIQVSPVTPGQPQQRAKSRESCRLRGAFLHPSSPSLLHRRVSTFLPDTAGLWRAGPVRQRRPGTNAVVTAGIFRRGQRSNTATVDLAEPGSPGLGLDAVVITAKRKGDSSASSAFSSAPQSSNSSTANKPLDSLRNASASILAGTKPAAGAVKGGQVLSSALIVGGLALIAGGFVAKMRNRGDRTVDALARRGFIANDRSVPLELIQDYEDPTRVRDYKIGNAKLVELEPLTPLTQEKVQYHRELRRREHGWKKPEHVLVEGEEVPEGIDPRTVRFIPKRHPFALSKAEGEEEWSEEVARRRLRQRRGRPEKEQQRSREQLDRLKRESELREAAARAQEAERGRSDSAGPSRGAGVLPSIDD